VRNCEHGCMFLIVSMYANSLTKKTIAGIRRKPKAGISTALAKDVLGQRTFPCNSYAPSGISNWFERRWRSSAGRASDL
jgi:hypothetical protein